MAYECCMFCADVWTLRPGPRNRKIMGCCPKCGWKALRAMAEEDMLTADQADDLNRMIGSCLKVPA